MANFNTPWNKGLKQSQETLVVDHCHTSGKVRGLLCDGCNREMAIVDNPNKLAKAQRYKSESN